MEGAGVPQPEDAVGGVRPADRGGVRQARPPRLAVLPAVEAPRRGGGALAGGQGRGGGGAARGVGGSPSEKRVQQNKDRNPVSVSARSAVTAVREEGPAEQ